VTNPNLVDRLENYSTDDTPFLSSFDAVHYLNHCSAVTTAAGSDSTLAAALATLSDAFAGLRAVGFSVATSPSSIIAEPYIITGVSSETPSN